MKKWNLFGWLLVSNLVLIAQKNDYNWIIGYTQPPSPNNNYESHRINFSTYPFTRTVVSCDLVCGGGCTTFSDDEGDFRFYSNGIKIYNSQFKLMENGNDINSFPGIIHTTPVGPPLDGPDTYSIMKPGSTNHAYILALEGELNFPATAQHLILTEIDLEANGGLGKVVSKGNVLIKYDSLEHCSIFKHANGRDWWFLAPQNFTNKYYRFLVTPDGVQGPFIQKFGYNDYLASIFRTVSKQGNRYAVSSLAASEPFFQGILLYDIDRCTGELSNEIKLPLSGFDPSYDGATISFSPDGRYLYFGYLFFYNFVFPGSCLEQFDLEAPDILASRDTVYCGLFQGSSSDYNRVYFSSHAVNAPDGKIYIQNHVRTYNVINFPTRPGEASQLQTRIRHVPSYSTWLWGDFSPFPNYRLGPIDGSSCDTLGLDNHPVANFRHDWEDSTMLRTRTFTDLSYYEPQTWHWDFGDGTTSQDTSPIHVFPADGVYNVCLIVCNQYSCDTFCQLVTIGGVAANEPNAMEELFIRPNPASDNLTVSLSKINETGHFQLNLTNLLGQQLLSQPFTGSQTTIDVSQLPPGPVFIQVIENGQVRAIGRAVIMR